MVFSLHFSKLIGFCLLNKEDHWQYSQFRHIIKHEMNRLWNTIPKQFAVLIILNWSKSKVHLLKNTKLSPSSTKSQSGPSNKKTWHIIWVGWFGKKLCVFEDNFCEVNNCLFKTQCLAYLISPHGISRNNLQVEWTLGVRFLCFVLCRSGKNGCDQMIRAADSKFLSNSFLLVYAIYPRALSDRLIQHLLESIYRLPLWLH